MRHDVLIRLQRAMLTLGCLVLLAGCASKFGPGQVARDWSCKIREMQIRPIFPPREDVHVGDVFWLQTVAANDAKGYCERDGLGGRDFLPLPIYMAHARNVTAIAKTHYEGRPDFPRSSSATGTVTVTATGISVAHGGQTTDATIGSNTLFTAGAANRTRLVGFPDFMSVRIDKASLGAIIPIQGVFTPLGFSSEEIDEASISVPVAESYSVPVASAWQAIRSSQGTDAICATGDYANESKRAGQTGDGHLHLVTEVFYTRAIDVNIQARAASAFGVSRDRSGAAATSVPSVTGTGIVTPGSSVGNGGTATLAEMAAVAGGLVQILNARATVPGVSLAVERGRASSVSMRRIFDRPVAIGYRSIAIFVKPSVLGRGCTVTLAQGASGGAGPLGSIIGSPTTGDGRLALQPQAPAAPADKPVEGTAASTGVGTPGPASGGISMEPPKK